MFRAKVVLSFHMPLYYSGVNYFSRRTKFRTIAIQPELRYNFRSVKGLFAGAHFDLAWYNIAASGNYRYQDHDGYWSETPHGRWDFTKENLSDLNTTLRFSIDEGTYRFRHR